MPHILGAPHKRIEQKKYEAALLARFGGDIERAVAYVDKVTDGQLSRASGFLSATSILAGMSYFVNARAALVVALVSIILVASMLYLPWPWAPEAVGNPQHEFELMCGRAYYRAICNRICVTLIILTVVLLAGKFLGWW